MRKRLRRIVTSAVVIAAMVFTAAGSYAAQYGAGTAVYENVKDMGNGFTYTNTISENSSGRQESFMAESSPFSGIKPIVIACDTIYGGLTLDKVINYAGGLGYNVIGGINTDFFSMDTKVPLGIVVENGVYKSSGDGYPSVTFDDDGNADVNDFTLVNIKLTNLGGGTPDVKPDVKPENGETPEKEPEGGAEPGAEPEPEEPEKPVSNAGVTMEFSHFNKMRQNGGGLYLFDEHFSTVSTRTNSKGWFVKMKIKEGVMKTKGTVMLEVADKFDSNGAVKIEPGYMYLTADDTSYLRWRYDRFAAGDVIKLETSSSGYPAVENCKWATGGGDVLIKNGAVTDTSKWNRGIAGKHPRTALGIKADGSILYYTVDGRRSWYSNGLSLEQVASELLAQGCVSAINFDGGGSTVMSMKIPGYTKAGTVSAPSDGSQRKCATYILFVNENAPDGVADLLHIKQDGKLIFKSNQMKLDYIATDKGSGPAAVPADTKAVVAGGNGGTGGSVSGNVYTAGSVQGMETLELSSDSAGIYGTGQIFTVTDLSDIKVTVNGKETSSITVQKGDQVKFTASGTFKGEPVIMYDNSFDYAVSSEKDLGTVKNGVLTVGDEAYGSGWVKISAGGITKTVKVNVAGAFSDIGSHWAKPYITNLYDKGIVNGSGGKYMPESNIKRGDFILMLYRASGEPAAPGSSGFADIPDGKYYAKAAGWAKENGIAMGSGGMFSPEDSMTREQAFAFIYRYLDFSGAYLYEGTAGDLVRFSDSGDVSEYAVVPAATLVNMEIVNGSDGMISPKASLTRGQMAKILDMALDCIA